MNSKPTLRSHKWFAGNDKISFIHRSWLKNQGHPDYMFDGRPVIGICNTWSDLTPCNAHLRILAEMVKRGVYEAGGYPLEFPVMSLGEALMRPTTMLYRNLASMDVEESIRANPLDGVVLLTGCDKTTPSTLMGACKRQSADPGPVRRAHAQRQISRPGPSAPAPTCLEIQRRSASRRNQPGRVPGGRIVHVSQQRPLHDHGHRLDDGLHGRITRA